MSFLNLYKPPVVSTPAADDPSLYGPDPYDINFAFPVHLESLETARVRLTPFIPAVHAAAYWEHVAPHNLALFRYYPWFHTSLPEVLAYVETVRANPEYILFAVIDKTRPDPARPELGGSFAGVMGLMAASPVQLRAEVAFVLIFKAFQRTHVASNAVGVLMRYCLELPSASPPGLGLRRVQWCAHPGNAASIRLATRMGLKQEALLQWLWVLPEALSEEGRKPREGDPHAPRAGRDSVMLAIYWEDWEAGGREHVQAVIDR
ncbi:hypothetical protein AcV7_005903 [Taiwanofungus camphoratus]|nr:hypothetical protein AcV7_005903 [Antrodia cinnamomea]